MDAETRAPAFAPALRLDGLLDTVVTAEVAEHVLAVAREALSNAARHAHASQGKITIVQRGQALQVIVENDGVGVGSNPTSPQRVA